MTENKSNHEKDKTSPADQEVSRRNFLKNAGIATGGVVGGALLGGFLGNPFKTEEASKPEPDTEEKPVIDYSETRQFFKRKKDFDVLSIATERIYPEDDHGAGAIGLGVPYFIDKQLASPWGSNAEDYMKGPFGEDEQSPLNRGNIFIEGLRQMDKVSQKEHGEDFPNLDEEQQIAILEAFESGDIEMPLVSSTEFFALLRQSTLEGCYSDPMYGGNKNMEGWKMREFPGARLSYADVVEEEDFVHLEPVSLKTQ